MPNMSLKKNEMPSQAPDVRNKNFLRGGPGLHRGAGPGRGPALPALQEQALRGRMSCGHPHP